MDTQPAQQPPDIQTTDSDLAVLVRVRRAISAYLVWYLAMVFAELAGWLQGSTSWLVVFAALAAVALGIEFVFERVGRLRRRISALPVRLFLAVTLVTGSTLLVVPGSRALFAPLLLLWFVPAALVLDVGVIVAAAVFALLLDLGVNLQVLTATPVHPEYYREVMSFMVLAVLLLSTVGIAREQRRRRAESGWQVKQLAEAKRQLQALVTQDTLTRAFKRHYFVQLLRQEKARVDRYDGTFSVCLLDVDRYEKLHETYGETVCTQVLRELAERVIEGVRVMDIVGHVHEGEEPVGRYGTTQFGLLLPATGLVGAMDCAERLRAKMEAQAFRTTAGAVYVTIAAGVAQYAGESEVEVLLERADEALALARKSGGNAVRALGGSKRR